MLLDEIGKRECLSPRFVALVRHLLDSPGLFVATVTLKGRGLIAEVKQRPDVVLVEVTASNREPFAVEWMERMAAAVWGFRPLCP